MILMKKCLNILITNILIILCFSCLVACEGPVAAMVTVADGYYHPVPPRPFYSQPIPPRPFYTYPVIPRISGPIIHHRILPNRPMPNKQTPPKPKH